MYATDGQATRVVPADLSDREQLREMLSHLRELSRGMHEIRERLAAGFKPHFTVSEFAGLVGRAEYTVRTWISQGKIAAFRVPDTGPKGRLLIPRAELESLVGRGEAGHVPAALMSQRTTG